MSTKLHKSESKRETKQVRVSLKTHRALKLFAATKQVVMSRLLDEAIKDYLAKNSGDVDI